MVILYYRLYIVQYTLYIIYYILYFTIMLYCIIYNLCVGWVTPFWVVEFLGPTGAY